MVTFKMQIQFLHLVKSKLKKSHSFLNVHDGPTVLVRGTKAELMSWLQQKTKSKTWGWCALA